MGAVKNAIMEAMEKAETLEQACDILAGRGMHGYEPEDEMMQEMWDAMQENEPVQGYATPTVADCKPGMWAELTNGWIVGPIIDTKFRDFGVYVKFGDGTWQLDVPGQPDIPEDSARLVKRIFKDGIAARDYAAGAESRAHVEQVRLDNEASDKRIKEALARQATKGPRPN